MAKPIRSFLVMIPATFKLFIISIIITIIVIIIIIFCLVVVIQHH